MAIEKRSRGALLLTNDDADWRLRVAVGDEVILGRGKETALPVPSIATDREHARVRFTNEGCTVEDLGSTSGTYLNGRQIRKAEPIAAGDVIRIGPFEIVVVSE